MSKCSKIKVYQLFEQYSLFYQPYIPPALDGLKKVKDFNIKIVAFKGKAENKLSVTIVPSYFYRRFIEKWLNIKYNKKPELNYIEFISIQDNVDILHLQHSFLFPKVKRLLESSLKNKPKVVITLRGGDTYIKPWINTRWKDFYAGYGLKVDAFITISEHQKKYLYEKWGIAKNKIHVIPISFGSTSKALVKYPNENSIKIISAFRMCWEKNIEGNLRVVKKLKEKGFNVNYDIFGDGKDSGQVYFLIDKYNLKDCTRFHEKIENVTFKKKLKEYDFFLQLSHSESFGGTVIEAQSQGVPCIVSNSGGLPEAIIPNQTGFCVDAYDVESAENCIIKLFQNPELYYSFSKAGINFVNNNFTIQHEVEKLVALYRKLACKS